VKVLVVLPFTPWPVRVRSANLWPRIAREAEVHVVYVEGDAPGGRALPLAGVASMQAVPCSRVRAAARVAAALPSRRCLRAAWHDDETARRAVEEAYRRVRPDVVYAERLRAVPLIETLPPERVVLDPTDSLPLFCEEVTRQPGAPLARRLIDAIDGARLIELERRTYPSFARVVACSQRDADAMRASALDARIEVVPNGVDLERFSFAPVSWNGHRTVLMSGNFAYWPNGEAARWLLGQAAALRARCRGEVVFAGANPPSYLLRAHRKGAVTTQGYVEDLSAAYHGASAVAAPVRFAGGTQNKVLEALACGRPVVATPQCARSLETAGRDSVVEARREGFVDALAGLLDDKGRQAELAERGRAYVERHHDWERIAEQMLRILECAAGQQSDTAW
jgi:glycosyltransferase involved in cell wall biosynthesis